MGRTVRTRSGYPLEWERLPSETFLALKRMFLKAHPRRGPILIDAAMLRRLEGIDHQWVSLRELCDVTRASTSTISNWQHRGMLPEPSRSRGRPYWSKPALMDMLGARVGEPVNTPQPRGYEPARWMDHLDGEDMQLLHALQNRHASQDTRKGNQ